jgi:uncharacterized protein YkwD
VNRRFWVSFVALLVLAVPAQGCQKKGKRPSAAAASAGPVERPAGPLGLDDARQYVLDLVNQDRGKEGLEPVEWDEVATKAAQRHVEDMTRHGYTAHWGTDGSVPEQRYTEAGGVHLVQENSACFFDAVERELDPDPKFDPVMLEKIELAFINETPPNDGHRRNILKPVHTHVGIGLAKPVGVEQPCMAQEFIDDYGEFDDLPSTAKVGQNVRIAGEVKAPVEFGGVGIARIEPAAPMSAEKLNATSTYRMPEPYILFFPEGFKTPKPVKLDGRKFSIEVALTDRGRPGRYEVSVWGKYPDSGGELVMVSLRTISVR